MKALSVSPSGLYLKLKSLRSAQLIEHPGIDCLLNQLASDLWTPSLDELIALKVGQLVLRIVTQMDLADDCSQPITICYRKLRSETTRIN